MGRAVKVDFEWSDDMEAVRAKVAKVHGIEGIGHTVTLTKFACLARSCVSDIVFAPHAKLAHPQAGPPVRAAEPPTRPHKAPRTMAP